MARPVRDGALAVTALAALLLLSGVVAGLHRPAPPSARGAARVTAGTVALVSGFATIDERERADADAKRWSGAGALGMAVALVALVLWGRLDEREQTWSGRTPGAARSRGPPNPPR